MADENLSGETVENPSATTDERSVFASLLAVVLGGAVPTTVYSFAVDLSTAAFVAAVVLLVWRTGTRDPS